MSDECGVKCAIVFGNPPCTKARGHDGEHYAEYASTSGLDCSIEWGDGYSVKENDDD